MQNKSWNLAVPFKEQRHHHTPSESIANNYTPTATSLKIKTLPNKRRVKNYLGDGYYRGGRGLT
jgi:dynein heavy chain